uniref:G-protein coupled receptors family 1 profile domain-containing protein n=1 Tax=Gasterosteus aculeatus aculeatus TaxID=481459 RepID=G3P122_GASAC|nr:trace amine-associated receptor 13c-like [Gasterosteus aculeatus aculeatus]XP_040040854.1 trace amine-associated receptor 13c-like [Gasterosteus aculeatus aculeatus]
METLVGTELCFPQLINTSCRKTIHPHLEATLIYILLSSISLLTVVLNLLVIISISHFKQLQTPTNLLLLSLAVSDFFMGLFMIFQTMIEGCWLLGDVMCYLWLILSSVVFLSSIETMVLISVDRYVAICYPLHYFTKVKRKSVQVCVCLCWMFAALINSVLLKNNLQHPGRYNSCIGQCVIDRNYIASIFDLIVTFIFPITVIIILYMRIFVVAVYQARAMRSHIAVVTLKATVKKSEMKAARNLGVLVVVFLICICPYYCFVLTSQNNVYPTSSVTIVIWLSNCNSCLNPLIYAILYPCFRKSIKVIVTLQILKSGSYRTNML